MSCVNSRFRKAHRVSAVSALAEEAGMEYLLLESAVRKPLHHPLSPVYFLRAVINQVRQNVLRQFQVSKSAQSFSGFRPGGRSWNEIPAPRIRRPQAPTPSPKPCVLSQSRYQPGSAKCPASIPGFEKRTEFQRFPPWRKKLERNTCSSNPPSTSRDIIPNALCSFSQPELTVVPSPKIEE